MEDALLPFAEYAFDSPWLYQQDDASIYVSKQRLKMVWGP